MVTFLGVKVFTSLKHSAINVVIESKTVKYVNDVLLIQRVAHWGLNPNQLC